MSTETEKLGLFKYNPDTDGASTFNIRQALNENWDKIDQNAKDVNLALSEIDQTISGLSPDKIGAASNHNLLDNWYFADPINQRGQTSYSGFGYGIDRWYIESGAQMQIMDGFVRFSGAPSVVQKISIPETGIYTFSILYRKTGGSSGIYIHSEAGIGFLSKEFDVAQEWTLYSGSFERIENSDLYFSIYGYGDTESSVDVKAVKFEYGSHQTLVHQDVNGNWVLNDPPPNKQYELAKCQGYYFSPTHGADPSYATLGVGRGNDSGDGAYIQIPTPVSMRKIPVITNANNLYLNGAAVTGISVEAISASVITVNARADIQTTPNGCYSLQMAAGANLGFSADL